MGYTFYNITSKKEYDIELPDCTITGNSAEYKIKDGKITKYSIMDGEIDESSGKNVDRIELTNYQLSFIDTIRKQDGNEDRLDENDLKLLDTSSLYENMNKIYSQANVYTIVGMDLKDHSAGLNLLDKNASSKQISVEIEKPSIWKRIGNFFKSIASWFKSLFSSSKEEANVKETEQVKEGLRKVFDNNVQIIPSSEHTVASGETGFKIAQNYEISLYRLKEANADIDWDKLKAGQKINIPESVKADKDIDASLSAVAQTAGVSENYIKEILMGIEGRKSKPDLKAYDDKVGKNSKGTLTIGFGHTGRVRGKILTPETTITKNEAYQLLAQDIIDAKLDAIEYFGDDFLNAPKSIQDAIVDIFFNKGVGGVTKEGSLTTKLKEDLKNKDYVSAAKHVIYKTPIRGLMKRNIYRVYIAVSDLSPEDRLKVLSDEEFLEYYQMVFKKFHDKPIEQKFMSDGLENANLGVCEDFFS